MPKSKSAQEKLDELISGMTYEHACIVLRHHPSFGNINRGTISRWMSGNSAPTRRMIEAIKILEKAKRPEISVSERNRQSVSLQKIYTQLGELRQQVRILLKESSPERRK